MGNEINEEITVEEFVNILQKVIDEFIAEEYPNGLPTIN